MDRQVMIGQHLVGGFPGTQMDDAFKRLVRKYKVGNVVLFQHNVENAAQLKRLCGEIQDLVREETGYPAFIMIDEEGGMVTRLPDDFCGMPGEMALSAAGSKEYVTQAAVWTAKKLKRCGVNFNLAPVLDVNNNPDNPVIGVRSFGDDPIQAAGYGTAAIKGYQQEGMLCCVKHFPGHGDTAVDSHLGLPVIGKSLEELEQLELIPFQAALDAGVPAVMTAHILFPAIEPDKVPCTMSRKMITGLLRGKMGFKGLVVSDCTEMKAIQTYFGTAKGVAAALGAGVDLALVSHTASLLEESALEVDAALKDGRLSEEEMYESAGKIVSFKEKYHCGEAEELRGDDSKELRPFVRQVRSDALCVTQGEPFCPNEKTFFAGCGDYRVAIIDNEKSGMTTFAGYMRDRFGGSGLITSRDPSKEEIESVTEKASDAENIVLGTCNAHLYTGQLALISALAQTGKPMMVIALRNPYDLGFLPENAVGIAAWDYREETLCVLADALETGRVMRGRMPVNIR